MAGWIFPVIIVFLVLQCFAAFARLYVRLFLLKRFGKDDAAMILTLILTCALAGVLLAMCVLSQNKRNLLDVRPQNLGPAIRLLLAAELIYFAGTAVFKVAYGLLILPLLVIPWQRRVIYGVMVVALLYGSAFFFYTLFECGNPAHFEEKVLKQQCQSNTAFKVTAYVHAVLNCVCDWICAVVPIQFLMETIMTRKAKITLCSILALGCCGSIVSVIRIGYVHQIIRPGPDIFNAGQTIIGLSFIELSIGLICICLPTCRPLIRRAMSTHKIPNVQLLYGPQKSGGSEAHREIELEDGNGVGGESDQESSHASPTVDMSSEHRHSHEALGKNDNF